jgi:GAF domain-containing protein
MNFDNTHYDPSRRQQSDDDGARDQDALDRLERASADVVFLSESGRILSSSINLQETFRNLAEVVVPQFADCCAVLLIDEKGNLRRLALKHVEPTKDSILQSLNDRFPFRPDLEGGMAQAVRTRKPIWVPSVNQKEVDDPLFANLIHKLDLKSYIATPMIVNGKLIGAAWFGKSEPPESHFVSDDVALAEELTRLAAQAIHNASLHQSSMNELERHRLEKRIREDFIRRQVHDIKTPLTAALLQIGLVAKKYFPNADENDPARKAVNNINRAVKIINNLLQ